MKLSDRQVAHFDTFGFLIFPELLRDEIDKIIGGFERVWADHGGGHDGRPHDHNQRSALVPFIDQDEYLSCLLDHPRIEGIASSLLGDDFNYSGSDGNYYVGDTNWHSDGFMDRKYASIKMALYLDKLTADTGCVRVIPGSHRFSDAFSQSIHEAMANHREPRTRELWSIDGAEVPAIAVETEPGDLVVFNHNTKHAAFGGGTRRRMFTINLEQRHSEEDLPMLRDSMATGSRFWIERAYGDIMIRTAGPNRMRHLEQRLANDDHLAELSRKARETMSEPARG
jgi:hypothetical protein